MAGQSQSWRNLTLQAQMFIGLIVTAGTAVLLYGAIHQSSKNIAEFICYLGIAVLASRMKVNLPGITGTMSVNFLFVLLGVLELSFSETLILGCVSILVQSFYPDRPNAIQVTFNVCAAHSQRLWPTLSITTHSSTRWSIAGRYCSEWRLAPTS